MMRYAAILGPCAQVDMCGEVVTFGEEELSSSFLREYVPRGTWRVYDTESEMGLRVEAARKELHDAAAVLASANQAGEVSPAKRTRFELAEAALAREVWQLPLLSSMEGLHA